MEESPKFLNQALGFLRGLPPWVRIIVLSLCLVPLAIYLHGHYNWPQDGLIKNSLWLNSIGSAFVVGVLFVLTLYPRRREVLVADLPAKMPVFEESLEYFKTGPELEGRHRVLLKDLQNAYETSSIDRRYQLSQDEISACARSEWEFDRVAFYLFHRYREKPGLDERIARVKHEIRLLEPRWSGSLVPLHYAVESVYAGLLEKAAALSDEQREPFERIVKKFHSRSARFRAVLTRQLRGERIIKNCRSILQGKTALVTKAAQGTATGTRRS